MAAVAVAITLGSVASAAQSGARVPFTPETFRQTFEGRTLHLRFGGISYGSEHYLPGDRTVWVSEGVCAYGKWAYDDGLFCFTYATDGPHCWEIYRQGGFTYAASDTDGLLLTVDAVDDDVLSCDSQLVS